MVGHHHLNEEAEDDEPHAFRDVLVSKLLLLVQLPQKVARPLDGTRDQLREKHHIERVIAEMPLSLLVAAIHLYHIAHALKGVKRQANRQDDMGHPMLLNAKLGTE